MPAPSGRSGVDPPASRPGGGFTSTKGGSCVNWSSGHTAATLMPTPPLSYVRAFAQLRAYVDVRSLVLRTQGMAEGVLGSGTQGTPMWSPVSFRCRTQVSPEPSLRP